MITTTKNDEYTLTLERTAENKIRITLIAADASECVLGNDYPWIRSRLLFGAERMGVREHQIVSQMLNQVTGNREDRMARIAALEFLVQTCADLADLGATLSPEVVTTYKRLTESSDWAFAKLMDIRINVSSNGDAFAEIDDIDCEYVARPSAVGGLEETGWLVGLSDKLQYNLPAAVREIKYVKSLTPNQRLMHDLGLLS